MKIALYSLVAFMLCLSCKKDNKTNASLVGVWVDKDRQEDTLVVYQLGNKSIMFDNSHYFRTNLAALAHPNIYKFQYRLKEKDNKIGIKAFEAPPNDPYVDYEFQWIIYKEEFRMSKNGIRPYLSSIGIINYKRVH